MSSKSLELKNNLLFNISCAIILVMVCFAIINVLTATKTLSNILEEKWDGTTIAISFSGGNGTKDNPFQISNGKELAYFKQLIEGSDSNNYSDKYYILTNNVDLGDNNWHSIGNKDTGNLNIFKGYLDGNGYAIKNFKITEATTINDQLYYGLFSITENADIKNLNINNISIKPNVTDKALIIGTLAGKSYNYETITEETVLREKENKLTNISVGNASIDLTSTKEHSSSQIGGIIGSITNKATLSNAFINLTLDSNYVNHCGKIVANLETDISNIVTEVSVNNLLLESMKDYVTKSIDSTAQNIYTADYTNNIFTITKDNQKVATADLIDTFNQDLDVNYEWSLIENNLSVVRIETSPLIENGLTDSAKKSLFAFPKAMQITLHNSGVEGNTVYVNDLESDYNYYYGLNYTSSSDGQIPTNQNKNIYNDSNLVKVYMAYNGADINDASLIGYVSQEERQDTYIYYKYYIVKNGYVEIELIDNPFTDRPNNKGFNGWVTDYNGASIIYDHDYYVRKVKIPISYTNGKPNDISITMYANWTEATITEITTNTTNTWSNAFTDLNDAGMSLVGVRTPIYENVNMQNYFIDGGTVNRRQNYPENSFDASGNNVSGSQCNSWGGCTYYLRPSSAAYDSNVTYYQPVDNWWGSSMEEYVPPITGYETKGDLKDGMNAAGYYRQVIVPNYSSISGYYNENGVYNSGGTCNNSGGCTYYELIQYYDNNGNINIVDNENNDYYYLVTRDTNIVVLETTLSRTWSSSQNKPFTFTGIYNDVDYTNDYFNISNLSIHCYNDTVIENMYIYTTQGSVTSTSTYPNSTTQTKYLYGEWNNVKIGRGLSRNGNYVNFISFIGGSNKAAGSSSNIMKYRLIVESGYYSSGASVNGGIGTNSTYTEAQAIYGSDYDRVRNDNSKFTITDCIAGFWGGNAYASSSTAKSLETTYKSGEYGSRKGSNTSGIYFGQRQGGSAYALRTGKIEGGWFYAINGGPSVGTNFRNLNSATLYITGGKITMLFGGAGRDTSYGNRIIQMTGGKIDYSLFGGSNAYSSTDNAGTIYGSSYIYVGGNSQVGDETLVNNRDTLFNSEAGSVFGHGNGGTGSSVVGSNDNSTVIIDGNAKVLRNVYGGSNNGLAGSTTDKSTTSVNLNINGGIIEGSIYGGGNNNGIGDSNINAEIGVSVTGGNIKGSVYGGTRTTGTVYGNTSIIVNGGVIDSDIYGGGEGNNTYVSKNTNVVIGDATVNTTPTINNNVYGGSAFGTVGGTTKTTTTSTYNTNTTVNKGIITGSVFGGGKGSTSYTPYVLGNVKVTINSGNIGQVFGGNDAAGSPNGEDFVYLNGGTIGNAFGGGNSTSQNSTNIFLQGATTTYLFGGSNASGTVTDANVTVDSGQVTSIYGGNNIGGNTVTSNVTINGATVTSDVYGGGKLASTTTTNIKTNTITLKDIYGGGESADATNTNIEVNNTKINNLFGGSNKLGEVNKSIINVYNGSISKIFGGNNQGGRTNITNILINNGNITDIYGGGNQAVSNTSNIDIYDGVITNIYGGGNEAGLTTSNVNLHGGVITNTYGGSNTSGEITNSNIKTQEDKVTEDVTISTDIAAEDATWQSSEYKTFATVNVTLTNNTANPISNWSAYIDFPNSILYQNWSGTEVIVENNQFNFTSTNKWNNNLNTLNANGGTYTFSFQILSNQSKDNFTSTSKVTSPTSTNESKIKVSNIYGGNNKGGKTSSTSINITAGNITNIFGGGNEAIVDNTNVIVTGGLINTIYGGGNQASVSKNTKLELQNATISTNIYGGGNEGTVDGNTDVSLTSLIVNGSAYAGGNGTTAIVGGNTTITVDGKTVIGTPSSKAPNAGCIFGGGNAAATGEAANDNSIATVNIVGATIYGNVYGGANTSVVYGKTFTNIGTKAVSKTNLQESNIDIVGTVFGGGEANASGSDIYDYSFISVTGAIDININGENYTNNSHKFELSGSIFGSGNASSSSGTSEIFISNLGTKANPSKNISVQRTNKIVINNSVIELEGTTDRTNEYSNIKYSFNRIDSLTIKNNTTLLLKQNANLLKELHSMVDIEGIETPANVNINDDDKTVTKNVDNRIYMLPNKNLNITTNEAATAYGKVEGMTFFGMYNSYANGSFSYGVYDQSFNYGDSADAGDAIIGGSYVLGLHNLNHDITKDGFYSNYLNDDYTKVTTAYIEPTPPDSNYYMWTIGIQAINYSFALTASKYSSLGTYELSMRDFAKGDTIFNVIGFNADGLTSGVNLIESNKVPKLADTDEEANSLLGLSVKTETQEWTSYETTKLLSANGGSYTGGTTYKTDSQALAPSLMFYLYHAKNIFLEANLGTVVVTLQAMTPINEIEYQLDLITITIELNARNYTDGDAYDASITYDKKYEMPATTLVNITNKSQFTAYYSMYTKAESFEKFYGKNNSNYHALTSSYALPVGTTITMLDYSLDEVNPDYYYYTVDQASYDAALKELENENEVTYKLSDFIKMGSTSTDNTYDDKVANEGYYDNTKNRVVEEFLFIFDLKNTTSPGNNLNNSMLFELRNSENYPLISVLGIRQPLMIYNLYESSNVVLNQSINLSSDYFYPGKTNTVVYSTNITYDQTANRESIINTNYESSNMGLNVSIYDTSNNLITSSLLTGTSIKIDGITYYADSDGVFRIKLSGKVSNLNKKLYLETDTNLPAGSYKMRFELFVSSDGLHNSYNMEYAEEDKDIVVVGSNNAILIDANDFTKLVDGMTGLNENGINYNDYDLIYNSELVNPNIRISIMKRSTLTKDDTAYEEVNFNDIFKTELYSPNDVSYISQSTYEKMVVARPNDNTKIRFLLQDSMKSGTYKLVFKLYDNNQLIEEEVKYIIVKKAVS